MSKTQSVLVVVVMTWHSLNSPTPPVRGAVVARENRHCRDGGSQDGGAVLSYSTEKKL